MPNIAFLEDEQFQAKILATLFQQNDIKFSHFETNTDIINSLNSETFDLLLLDWFLPDGTADKVINHVRNVLHLDLPILILSAHEDEEIIVNALQIGADDYVVKPLRKKELLARIEGQLRRYSKQIPQLVNPLHHQVEIKEPYCYVNQIKIKMSDKELEIMKYFLKNVGILVSREKLLENAWGITAKLQTRTVDTHVSRLRKKLSEHCENILQIVSVHGHGYRLEFLE